MPQPLADAPVLLSGLTSRDHRDYDGRPRSDDINGQDPLLAALIRAHPELCPIDLLVANNTNQITSEHDVSR